MKKYLWLLAIAVVIQGCGVYGKYPQGSGGNGGSSGGGNQNPNGGRQQTPTQYPEDRSGGNTNQGGSQTENAYEILIYHRPIGARADALVGYSLLKSN